MDKTPVDPEGPTIASFLSLGTRCAATIHHPVGTTAPGPAVVMAHGLGGTQRLRLGAYAATFAAAGYLVVTFDYRGFGDSDGHPRQVLRIRSQLADWRAALAFARGLPDVDARRVVAWGTSLAGGHVLRLAGTGEDLAAVIAQVPHVSGTAAVLATGVRPASRLASSALRDTVRGWTRRDPIYVPLTAKPGAIGVMTSPDAHSGLEKLEAESEGEPDSYQRDVAARIALTIGLYSPIRVARRITSPTLVQIAKHDAITPPGAALRAARRIRESSVQTYPCGHFDPYVEPMFHDVITDQLAFLQEHVPARR